jgi:hypothetical protein
MRTWAARRVLSGIVAGGLGMAFWAGAPGALAQDAPPVALEWKAPGGCPTKQQILAGVERILGGRGSGTRQAVSARAVVSKVGADRWTVVLTTRTDAATGERTVGGDSCKAVGDAAALVLALAVNPEASPAAPLPVPVPLPGAAPTPGTPTPVAPEAAASATQSSEAPVPTNPPLRPAIPPTGTGTGTGKDTGKGEGKSTGKASELPSTPGSTPSPPPKPPHRFAVTFAGLASLGPLPNLAAGGEAALVYRPWRLRFELGGAYWAPQTQIPSTAPHELGHFQLGSVFGRAGYPVRLGAFELVPSLLVQWDFMSADAAGTGVTQTSKLSPWLAVGGGGAVFWMVTREFALRLGVEAAVPLARPSFQVGSTQVFQPSQVDAKGAIGFEVRFL